MCIAYLIEFSDWYSWWTEERTTRSPRCDSLAWNPISTWKQVHSRFTDTSNIFSISIRFIRTQAAHERLNNPSKKKTHKNKDFYRFQEILDCCLYFSQQSNRDKQSSVPLTTNSSLSTANVLTARTLTNKEQQTVDKEGKLISLYVMSKYL